jgi:NAD(P)-dependent dehydrogenase (short-subunit alcohol dehydrogenase family)
VVGPLDLCDLGVTERFCDALHARFERIDVLINNAAQTLTRAPEWFEAMDRLEEGAARDLPPASRQLLLESASSAPGTLLTAASSAEARGEGRDAAAEGGNAPVQEGPLGEGCGLVSAGRDGGRARQLASSRLASVGSVHASGGGLGQHFPPDRLDESMQPLDLSPINSWSRKLGQIGTGCSLRPTPPRGGGTSST